MTRVATILCCALLSQLSFAADVVSETPGSDPNGKQCLMQKAHVMSRSDTLGDKPKASEQAPAPKDAAKKEESFVRTKKEYDKQVKALMEKFKTQPRPKPKGGKKGRGKLLQHASKAHGNKGKSLLQTKGRARKSHKKKHHKTTSHKKTRTAGLMQVGSAHRQNPALDLLPEPVKKLAFKLFKEENAIAGCIENSILVDVTYAGEKMQLRMNKFDDASKRLGEEAQWFGYDLDTLSDAVDGSGNMLNMLDVGGNYGVVTIAAMKKYAKKLRVVAVEPIPETFFFLTWNLYLNGIPVLDEATLKDDKHASGVLALNSGSADVAGEDLHFCAYPWASMNSKVCDCQRGQDNCHIVPSASVDNLVGMFGSDPIAMVKMDCEGCEFKSLPALDKPEISKRVRRLAGELHLPDKKLEDIACRWDNGRLLSKCQQGGNNNVECGVKLACPL